MRERETERGRVSEREMVLALVRLLAQPTAERADSVGRLLPTVDLPRLLELLAKHRLVAALGGLLLADEEIELPSEITEQIQAARLRARQRGLLNHGITMRVTRALEDAGIAAVPLKGAMLADAVYGDIGSRLSSDIDLLVPVADLDRAVDTAERQGWREPEPFRAPGLPRLHRELMHESLPPLELHWRIHWNEDEAAFSAGVLARAERTEDGWLRPQPTDEVASLLLFLARDGFAGLRQTVDVAAWWGALGGDAAATGVRAIADAHPELEGALVTAARHAEGMLDLPDGALGGDARLSGRQRAALRLANPWAIGSPPQLLATVSLIDGLLTPSGERRAFIRWQLFQPRHAVVRRHPHLHEASRTRIGAARGAHVARVLIRYGIALGSLMRPRTRHAAR